MQDDSTGLWPVSSIIAECKAQARQTLDPGFTRFMNAAATALEAQSREIAELRETERRLSDGLALSRAENLRLRDDITQATAERDDTQAQLMEAVSVMEMARERMDAISREIASRSGIALAPDTRRGQELRCQLATIKTFLAQSKGTQND